MKRTFRSLFFSVLICLLTACGGGEPQQAAPEAEISPETNSVEEMAARYADVDFAVVDVGYTTHQERLSAVVTFSNPLALDRSLDKWLVLERAGGERVEGAWVADKQGMQVYFPGLSPDTEYLVRVKEGLPSATGKKLLEDYTSETVSVESLKPLLGFAGQGHFLAHKLAKGLPVLAVNADQVEVDFYRVPEVGLAQFLSEHSGPGQLKFWRLRDTLPDYKWVYSGRFDLHAEPDVQITRYLPVNNIQQLEEAGVYVAVMRRTGEYLYDYPATWFAVTDLGVQARVFRDLVEVNVNALSDAGPVADVEISLLDKSGKILHSTKTTAAGRVSFSAEVADIALLMAQKGRDITLVPFSGPALELSEFPVAGAPSLPQSLYLYSSRDIYRPGSNITVSGLLRGADGELVPASVLEARLQQPDGRTVASQRIKAGDLNYYEASFPLPGDSPTGQWRINVVLPGGTEAEYPFWVEDFLPERMTLELTGAAELEPQGQLTLHASGAYLYGAPAAGNKLKSRLIASIDTHPYENFSDYHFGDLSQTQLNRQMDLDDLTLNEQGNAHLKVKNFWATAKTPLKLKLFESLLDTGGRPVSRSFTARVLPADKLPGIRPLFDDDTAEYGSSAGFEIIYTDGDARLPLPGAEVTLVQELRRYYWVYSEEEGWQSNYTERHYPVFRKTLDIQAEATAKLALPVEWGFYRLEVKDPHTGLVSSYRFQAGWSEEAQTLSGRPDRIGISLDKQAYQTGDTATVRVQPPAPGRGYLSVESGEGVLYWQEVDVGSDGASFEIPVKSDWKRHDLYITLSLIQPGLERDQKLPRRMLGVQPLKIDRENRRLAVQLQPPKRAFPDQTTRIPVQVSTGGSLPDQVEITLAAVDLGILNITEFTSPDPFKGFFGQRRYGAEIRDNYGDLIDAGPGKLAELRFGGDADLQRGGAAPPSDVQIISLFSGAVALDSAGRGEIALDFPDFNGRVRLMAVAFSADKFGADDAELQVAAPVVTQLTMPRFLSPSDRSELVLDLHNLSGTEQTLDMELTLGQGLAMQDGSVLPQQLSLKNTEKRTVRIPVRATQQFGEVPIKLHITGLKNLPAGAEADIERRWVLGTRPAWPASDYLWQQVLEPQADFQLPMDTLGGLMAGGLAGNLSVSAKPPLNSAAHLQALKAYPYGCLEQTTSGVFAQLKASSDMLQQLGIQGEGEGERQRAVNLAIQRLMSMQKSNGAFGLWSASSQEEHWLTVYVTDFLLRAREQGFVVPEANLKQALARLGDYLRNPRRIYATYGYPRTPFAVRAYAAQVLSRLNQAPLSELRNMFDNKQQKWTPLGLLQLGLALEQAGDTRRAEAALSQARVALLAEKKFITADYGSQIRDLALALFWSLEAERPTLEWEPLLMQLSRLIERRNWFSTQERNALFLADVALQEVGAEPLDIRVIQGHGERRVTQKNWHQRYHFADLESGLLVENLADRNAYLAFYLQGYTQDVPTAISQGVKVQRRYYTPQGQPLQELNLITGDLVLVELDIALEKEKLHHLLVVDLLPAGLELENQNLATAYELSDLTVNGESPISAMQRVDIQHQEFRGDRYVAAIEPGWNKKARLYYLARAVSPGSFRVPPTFAEAMYSPSVRHIGSEGGRLTVQSQ